MLGRPSGHRTPTNRRVSVSSRVACVLFALVSGFSCNTGRRQMQPAYLVDQSGGLEAGPLTQ